MDKLDIIFYYKFYEDLRNANINTPRKLIKHYHEFGKNEGRFINKNNYLESINFNYQNYRDNYNDLINLDDQQLAKHYISQGRFENRIFNTKLPFHNEIDSEIKEIKCDKIIIFHVGNFNIFEEIINDYPIIKNFNLIITYYDPSYQYKFNEYDFKYLKILKVENKGTDCGPMLLCIKFLLNNSHLYNEKTIFYKIHTKTIKDMRNILINDMLDFDSKHLDSFPIIFGSDTYIYNDIKGVNQINIRKIVNRNEFDKNISIFYDVFYEEFVSGINNNKFSDLLPSYNFYKNYEPDLYWIENLEHWNLHGIHEFHRKSNINYIKSYGKYTQYFIAGTIFGFNKKYLDLFKKYNIDYEYSILEEGYVDNTNLRKIHAWEYYFGLICYLHNGYAIGINNTEIYTYKSVKLKEKIKYSIINIPFKQSKIAIFLIPPGDNPDSGGYRTLLNYINLLNNHNYSLDIYFGICWNDTEVYYNVNDINSDGMPSCKNWINKDNYNIIYEIIKNISKYNAFNIKKNNFYLGFKCQRKYNILIANAWQTANAVYCNRDYAEKLVYIIQDREELFYLNDDNLKNNVSNTYKKEYNYYCITQYLGNYFKKTYDVNCIASSYMGVNLDTYKNLMLPRNNSVVIPYYGELKPGRKPVLVEKIIEILSSNNIKCYIYPFNYDKNNNKNIINLGTMNETELNQLYNKYKVGIVFSNTNPSRLGFEMYASGLQVIEYESEFTKYDMPDKYFTKITDEKNILDFVDKLFCTEYDSSFLKNIDINNDYDNFLNCIKQYL